MSTQPPFVQSGQSLPEFLKAFWERQIATAEQETPDYRHPPLPLARIKKVMKSDPDVKASCNAFLLASRDWFFLPYIDDCCWWYFSLFLVKHVTFECALKIFSSNFTKLPFCSAKLAKVCTLSNLEFSLPCNGTWTCPSLSWPTSSQILTKFRTNYDCSHLPIVFIAEITGRAFIVADSNKRRTLSRADIAKALTKSDHFDFLIDIVPREEATFPGQPAPNPSAPGASGAGVNGAGAGTSAGVIMRKGGSGGKPDMVSNANISFLHTIASLLILNNTLVYLIFAWNWRLIFIGISSDWRTIWTQWSDGYGWSSSPGPRT